MSFSAIRLGRVRLKIVHSEDGPGLNEDIALVRVGGQRVTGLILGVFMGVRDYRR